ncbi:MAG: serine hydrolase [Bryobacteraceae bacterium]|nr:serine hydrolase [Bryobacteraceae bacterium]
MLKFAFPFLIAAALWGQTPPVSGLEVPELAVFDRVVLELMQKYKLPGGSLTVVDRGRLVLARGYGLADREANQAVQPFHLFRLASLSKSITSVGVMKLVQDGKLKLDAKLVDVLPDLQPAPGQTLDPRFRNVTINQLLWHSFGSDRAAPAGDPAFRYADAQKSFSGAPHSLTNLLRFGFGLPLQFDPGAKYAYSNLGYHLLGRVIEKASGKPYETYFRDDVLAPMGISSMRVGRTLLAQRYADEVRYYDYEGAAVRPTLVTGATGNAPRQYGGIFLTEICDSYGGWVASTVDLARFLTSIDGRRGAPPFLTDSTYRTMLSRPPYVAASAASYYGMGWNVRPADTRFTYWHSGSLPGTRTYLASFANGRAYAVVFNTRPRESEEAASEGAGDPFLTELDAKLGAAFGQVTTWPTHDLFPQFARETLNASADTLSFFYQVAGAEPTPQTLNLTSSGASIFASANLAANTPWLRLTGSGGYTPSALRVSVSPAALLPGEYSALINVASADARNSPRTVRVVLRVFAEVMVRNAASLTPGAVAPGSLAVADGSGFGADTTVTLAGVDVPVLNWRPNRLIFAVPADAAPGEAALSIRSGGADLRGALTVEPLAPGLFSADRSGRGAALATLVLTAEDGSETAVPAYECSEDGTSCVSKPLEIPAGSSAVLRLTATGVRGQADLSVLTAKVGDADVAVASADIAEEPGRDTITLRLPADLAGRGEVDVVVTAGGRASNAVKINLR